MTQKTSYPEFLKTQSASQWRAIGLERRAGVAVALFSIHSERSAGIGELPDLKPLTDWCQKLGLSILQLLPMNDTGWAFRPYDAQSSFALEPVYLGLDAIRDIDHQSFREDIRKIKRDFPTGGARVDYRVKAAKMALLWKMFESASGRANNALSAFIRQNAHWLNDYSLFKAIKQENEERSWEEWGEDLRTRKEASLADFTRRHKLQIDFHHWLQWQIFEQFREAKEYARSKNVLLMGDIPFLVARDSADVWSHQDYFKLDYASGAPPDLLYAKGQRWGMPPFDWTRIAGDHYAYVTQKLQYAQNFYDLYRIDHVVGIFRVWSIPIGEPPENGGLNGAFDPPDESVWEEHGRQILSRMIKDSSMLACAEDLGTVPPCCIKVMRELGIPGIDVQRWMREWGKTYAFKPPQEYRPCAISTIATHDMSNLCAWWDYECGTVDEVLFDRHCRKKNIVPADIKDRLFEPSPVHGRLRWKKSINTKNMLLPVLGLSETDAKDFLDLYAGSFGEKKYFLDFLGTSSHNADECSTSFVKGALQKAQESACIFSIHLIHDYLALDPAFKTDPWENRINFPGTLNEKNWTLTLRAGLEKLLTHPVNPVIRGLNEKSNAAPAKRKRQNDF